MKPYGHAEFGPCYASYEPATYHNTETRFLATLRIGKTTWGGFVTTFRGAVLFRVFVGWWALSLWLRVADSRSSEEG